MSQHRRARFPRLDQLLEVHDECLLKVDKTLEFSISSISNDKEKLLEFINDLKSVSDLYLTASHDSIVSLYKVGSIEQANDLREKKRYRRREVKESLVYCTSCLQKLGFDYEGSLIDSNSTSQSEINYDIRDSPQFSHDDLTLNTSEPITRSEPVVESKFMHASDSSCNQANYAIASNSQNSNVFEPISNKLQSDVHADANSSQRTLRTVGSVHSPTLHRMPNIYDNNCDFANVSRNTTIPIRDNNQSYDNIQPSYVPLVSSNTYNPIIYNVSSSFESSIPANSKSIYSSNAQSSIDNNMFSTDYSRTFAPTNTTWAGACNRNASSSKFEPFAAHSRYNHAPSVSSSFRSSAPFSQQLHGNPVPQPIYIDSGSSYHSKQQLFAKSSNPFTGEPYEYNKWMTSLANKMSGISLTPYDKLLIFEANTDREPLKLVKKHMDLRGHDPAGALESLLQDLREDYGSSIHIANSLMQRVESFQRIESPYHVQRLKDLLYLCEYIVANMSHVDDLTLFNTSHGASTLWRNCCQMVCKILGAQRVMIIKLQMDAIPNFPHLYIFLKRKLVNYQIPCFRDQ